MALARPDKLNNSQPIAKIINQVWGLLFPDVR
jgi:hypothetical protein